MKPQLWIRTLLALVWALASSTSWSLQISHPHIKWAVQTNGPIRGAPTVTRDAIYVGSADGFVYAVKKSGDLIWKFDTGAAIAGAPAVTDELVIVAGRSRKVYALDRQHGSVRWSFEMQPTLPTATEWNFYTASPVVDAEQVLVPSGDGALYALEHASGKLRWKFQTGDSLRAAPLVADGTIYQPSGDDYVYALSRDGKLRWKFETEGTKYDLSQGFIRSDIFSKPALEDKTLVFASRDANVYAVDIETHQLRWKFAYDTTWAMSSTVDDGTVFVGWSQQQGQCAGLAHGQDEMGIQFRGAHVHDRTHRWRHELLGLRRWQGLRTRQIERQATLGLRRRSGTLFLPRE
ncbi:MAG TPA: PQQ-binding-like beta-propeller repeat protein [Steroidobacteraceae bacterium]|nr:PQQ-binding-like beta-propeller repeat protein [Steroidobacteraceae bacterium]